MDTCFALKINLAPKFHHEWPSRCKAVSSSPVSNGRLQSFKLAKKWWFFCKIICWHRIIGIQIIVLCETEESNHSNCQKMTIFKKICLPTSYNSDSDNKQVNSLGNGRFQIIFSQFDKSLFPDIHDELPVWSASNWNRSQIEAQIWLKNIVWYMDEKRGHVCYFILQFLENDPNPLMSFLHFCFNFDFFRL